ncbi:hypothetical protein X740_02965 [Mesorhizobium sp. LNHC221B00]|nr:hypothetical protein X740_02965 [Mesorhizobium sp. LNHC221B00]
MGEVIGDGSAELARRRLAQDHIAYPNGGEAILKAK